MNLGLMMGLAGGLGETGRFLEDRRKFMTEEEERKEAERRWKAEMDQSQSHFTENMNLQKGIHEASVTNQNRQYGLDADRAKREAETADWTKRRTHGLDILKSLEAKGIIGGDPFSVLKGVDASNAINLVGQGAMPGLRAPGLADVERAAQGVRSKLPVSDQESFGFIPGSEAFGGMSAKRTPFAPNRSDASMFGYGVTNMNNMSDFITAQRQLAERAGQAAYNEFMVDSRTGLEKKFGTPEATAIARRHAESLKRTAMESVLNDAESQGSQMWRGQWPGMRARPRAADVIPPGRSSQSPRQGYNVQVGSPASSTRLPLGNKNPLSDIP